MRSMLTYFHQVLLAKVIENLEGILLCPPCSFLPCNAFCIPMLVTYYLRTPSLCPFDWLASTLFILIVSFVFSSLLSLVYRV